MAENTKSINLLPQKGEGFISQFLNWALTVGRLLIILTETLALGVFFYRFSLDMKISDLHDSIKNQSAIVSQFKTTEDSTRSLQNRLSLAEKYDTTSGITPVVFSDVIKMGRGLVTFTNLFVSTDTAKIEAQATSSNALSTFVNRLRNYPGITGVDIDGVENKNSSAIIKMTISAHLKKI